MESCVKSAPHEAQVALTAIDHAPLLGDTSAVQQDDRTKAGWPAQFIRLSCLFSGATLAALMACSLTSGCSRSAAQTEIRQLLADRNAALQAGDGTRLAGLVYFPTIIEKTGIGGLMRAVKTRATFLRVVAQRLGSSAAMQVGGKLPVLREIPAGSRLSVRINGGATDAQISIDQLFARCHKTAGGWKIRAFDRPLSVMMANWDNAANSFEAASNEASLRPPRDVDEALRLFTARFNNSGGLEFAP